MGQKTVNTFNKGLDFDTSFNKYSTNNYLVGENVRLITSVDYNLNGALSSALGNDEWFTFQTQDEYLIGMCEIREWTVIISAYTNGNRIYKIPTTEFIGAKHLNIASRQIRDGKIGATGLAYNRYTDVLDTPVQIIPRPENPNLLKLYVIDGKSQMKVINVASPTIATQSPETFDIVYKVGFVGGIPTQLTSGNLKAGRVQYTYQFYKNNGSETVFNPHFSYPMSLTKSNEFSNSTDYRGTVAGEQTGKGVKVTIYNYNGENYSNYDKMRIIRIHYSTFGQKPTYTIVADIVPSYYITEIVDTGQDLGSLTEDEINYLIRVVTPKSIETKNNYLILGNINEETFDIGDEYDARAKRYNSSGSTYIGDFNPYNVLSNDGSYGTDYYYKSDGATEGGSGRNINYEFYTVQTTLDDLPATNTGRQLLAFDANDNVANLNKGYFRDEIYRFGIVFFDNYGRSSFVKWIDDIRMPVSDIITYSNSTIYSNRLFVKFNVDIPSGLQSRVHSFQIVRCKRDATNRTIISCGITGHVEKKDNNTGYFLMNQGGVSELRPRYLTSEAVKPTLLEFITPEYNFNNKSISTGSRIDLCNHVSNHVLTDVDDGSYNFAVTKIRQYTNRENVSRLPVTGLIGRNYSEDENSSVSIDGINIINLAKSPLGGAYGLKGSVPIVQLSSGYVSTVDNSPRYSRLRQETYPYGGANLNSISFNEFIPASDVVYIFDGTYGYEANATYGDCNIGMFEYNRGIWEDKLDGTDNIADVMYIPVESTIDFNYVINPTFNTLYDGGYKIVPYYAMHEVAGIYGIDSDTNLYAQEFNLYTYNSVYSQISDSRAYIAKPINYSSNNRFDTRLIKSEEKVNGESSDSWTKFYPNNFKDLDGRHGSLIALYTFNNEMYFFQEKAYGYLPIQEKSVTTTSDGKQTVLGIGGVLERFDYINTGSGITHLRNLTSTQNALYFYDTNNNKICSFRGSHEVLSDKLGVGSFVNSIAQNIYNHTQPVTLIHDYLRNEVSFSFFGLNKSLIYSELAQSFVSMDTYNTLDYYRIGNDVFSYNQNFGNGVVQSSKIYKHNVDILGDIPNYYGVDAPVKIAVVVNPNNIIVNRYDVLSFTFNENTKIDTYRCYNSYQDTGIITVNDENLLRRFRTWRTNTLFNSSDDTRLKDTYLIVEITYLTGADRIVVSDIVTTYTPLNLWGDNSA